MNKPLAVLSVLGLALGLGLLHEPTSPRPAYALTRLVNQHQASAQESATLAMSDDGAIHVAWVSRRQRGGLPAVVTRRVDAAQPEAFADPGARGAESAPVLVAAGQHTWLAWEGTTAEGTGVRVRALGAAETYRVGDEGRTRSPALAAHADGRALVACLSVDGDVLLQGLAADAPPRGMPSRLGVRAAAVAVAAAPDGGYAVAWSATLPDGRPAGISLARCDRAGELAGALVGVPGASTGIEPSLAAGDDGTVWLAFMQRATAGRDGYDVALASLKPAAACASAPAIVATAGPELLSAGAVAADRNGRVAVSWSALDPTTLRTAARVRVGARGAWLAPIEVASPATSARSGALAFAPDGSLLVAWSGDGGRGDRDGVHVTWLPGEHSGPAPAWLTQDDLSATAAVPHEPPSFAPVEVDQGSAQRPLSNGPDFAFRAIDNTGWSPPDPHMAVGPSHVVTTTNGGLAFFAKTGTRSFFQTISGPTGFWGAQGATSFVFDPEVHWDPWAHRFVAFACERNPSNGTGSSYFVIAVSDDTDPNGTWHKYRIDVTALANTGGGGGDIDSPNLGIDATAFYLTADHFNGGQKYLVVMLDKTPLLAGQPVGTQRSLLIQGSQSYGIPVMWSAGNAMYMIEHFEAATNTTVRLHAIRNPLGAPTRVTFDLTVPAYGRPGVATHAGATSSITLFDARFWSCVFRGSSLWACHHHGSTAMARWYQIDVGTWPTAGTPRLVQSGDVAVPSTHLYFNSIAVNASGDALMTFARSSASEFISIARTYRLASDPLGTMRPPVNLVTNTSTPSGSRWGDYSQVAADPADPAVLWYTHEALNAGSWTTWVGRRALADWLAVTPASLSATAGGRADFALEAPPGSQGHAYIVLGSLSGTTPGTPLGPITLPVNFDSVTAAILANLGSPVFAGFLGTLSATGCAGASLLLPPVPVLAGRTLHFAFATWSSPTWRFASNAVSLALTP